MSTILRCGIASVVLFVWFVAAVSAEVKIEEQIVGPAYDNGMTYILSPKGLYLATVHPKGSRFAVTMDGVQGLPFDEILKSALNDLRYGYAMI